MIRVIFLRDITAFSATSLSASTPLIAAEELARLLGVSPKRVATRSKKEEK
jgi:hypothetical protein